MQETILNSNVWGNLTANQLKQDAEKALNVLIQQPEVDPEKITLIGPGCYRTRYG